MTDQTKTTDPCFRSKAWWGNWVLVALLAAAMMVGWRWIPTAVACGLCSVSYFLGLSVGGIKRREA